MANQHVTPHNGQWQVKRENASRATKVFTKKPMQYLMLIVLPKTSMVNWSFMTAREELLTRTVLAKTLIRPLIKFIKT